MQGWEKVVSFIVLEMIALEIEDIHRIGGQIDSARRYCCEDEYIQLEHFNVVSFTTIYCIYRVPRPSE